MHTHKKIDLLEEVVHSDYSNFNFKTDFYNPLWYKKGCYETSDAKKNQQEELKIKVYTTTDGPHKKKTVKRKGRVDFSDVIQLYHVRRTQRDFKPQWSRSYKHYENEFRINRCEYTRSG